MKKIAVIGSTNIDMVMNVPRLPLPGETIGDGSFSVYNGGKGANQAVAVARLGGDCTFVTCLGDDVYANKLLEDFKVEGINTSLVSKKKDEKTGTALIFVDNDAENCIGVAPGANASLTTQYFDLVKANLADVDVVLLQMEIPVQTIEEIILWAGANDKYVVLNTAPATPLRTEILNKVDLLIMNETEASEMLGIEYTKENEVADKYLSLGVSEVIITLGSKGSFYASSQESFFIDSVPVKAIDTVAAGDTFCGAVVVALSNHKPIREAMQFASAAAAISVTKAGAQSAIPMKEEVLERFQD